MSYSEHNLLRRLLSTPSVNPSFSDSSFAGSGEGDLTHFLQEFCCQQGWPWLRQQVHPGRDNLLALVEVGNQTVDATDVMLWDAHQDTVGTQGMSIEPFAGEIRDGRIWGRGACDVKGAMAAILSAAQRLSAESSQLGCALLLSFTVNEECGFTGIRSLARLWDSNATDNELGDISGPLELERVRRLRPSRVIVAEPTSLDVVVAHQGVVRWQCRTKGRAAHTSRPDEGVNAIYAMARIVQTIEAFHRDELSRRTPHPLCGRPSASVTTIRGGTGTNTVPEEAVIDIDRRLAPGEQPEEAYQELVALIERSVSDSNAQVENELPWLESKGLSEHNNRDWAEQLAGTVRSFGVASELVGAPYGTNAAALAAVGIPTVVFGPGSIEQAHTEDEWIDAAELSQAVEILCRLATS